MQCGLLACSLSCILLLLCKIEPSVQRWERNLFRFFKLRLTLRNMAIWYLIALAEKKIQEADSCTLEHPVNLFCKISCNLFEIITRPVLLQISWDCFFRSADIFKSLTNKIKPHHCPSVLLVITSVTLTDFTSPQIMKSYRKLVWHHLVGNQHVYFCICLSKYETNFVVILAPQRHDYCSLIKHINLGILDNNGKVSKIL